ncbi:unnamed protein product [Cyprideis torosa]|uniref:Regulator of microtubule dynamics protein 1 n=1 Tax=Cyprideis torosa TaxID=163714 RepID=A0A7R8ZLD2_9CRUS|nr:unnamed protein product [Cyprideis torosa]CAG0886405.1 unnamed protein product [Cyprideis torosa]
MFSATGSIEEKEQDQQGNCKQLSSEELCTKADQLYKERRFGEAYHLLCEHKNDDDPQLLWRLARLMYEKAKGESFEAQKETILNALTCCSRALELDENCFAIHKWMSILLDAQSKFEGPKSRILNAFKIKEHMVRACALKPEDGTSWHLLGMWCFTVADMPWYQRKAANVFLATMPESSFDEALQYFTKAEISEPMFYSMNLLMLGECYLKLGNLEMARKYLQMTKDYPDVSAEDTEAIKRATYLLEKYCRKL